MAYTVTDKGLEIISKRIKGLGTEPLYVGWGTGTGTVDPTRNTLFAEDATSGYARVAGVSALVSVAVANDGYRVSGTLTAIATLIITEWALFDALSGGNMLVHEVISPGLVLAIGQPLNFALTLQNSRCS